MRFTRPQVHRSVAGRVSLALALLLAAPGVGAETLTVPSGSFPTVQSAIDAAGAEDTVLVLPGTYREDLRLVGQPIRMVSAQGADVTILEGSGSTSVLTITGEHRRQVLVEGFTIQGGAGVEGLASRSGGGVFCRGNLTLVLSGNRIVDNTANLGGGVAAFDCSLILDGNEIEGNGSIGRGAVPNRGGGVYVEASGSVAIRNNQIRDNVAEGAGGGIFLRDSTGVVESNQVVGNRVDILAFPTVPLLGGGGIKVLGGTDVFLRRNLIAENSTSAIVTSPLNGGGGVLMEAAVGVIDDNEIRANSALGSDGGGISLVSGNFVIENNLVAENRCFLDGGGVHIGGATSLIFGNIIRRNESASGGGIGVSEDSDVEILSNRILFNTATFAGGGLSLVAVEDGAVEVNRFVGNSADRGGGASILRSFGRFSHNVVLNNRAEIEGGGYFVDATSGFPTSTFLHETVVGNRAETRGGGLLVDRGAVEFENSILWGNESPAGSQISVAGQATAEVNHSDVDGGWSGPGDGNLDEDPLFVRSGGERPDLHLRFGSPCRNAGELLAKLPPTDADGNPRVNEGIPDIGAYEHHDEIAARFGTVNGWAGDLQDVLLVNGDVGGSRREIAVTPDAPLRVELAGPLAGPVPAGFVLYVFAGRPTPSTVAPQIRGVGVMTFATPLDSSPGPIVGTINSLGHPARLGATDLNVMPGPAPIVLADRMPGLSSRGTYTLQGFIEDASSPNGVSVTNAIVLDIR